MIGVAVYDGEIGEKERGMQPYEGNILASLVADAAFVEI
jgi:hypothetical protein